MIKVMSVFGTRPEAIKMCPLVKALERDSGIESIVCVTAQHREMLDSALGYFEVKPDYDLNIMKRGQTLSSITADVILGLEDVLAKAKPDIVLVHGDTTTSFAAALAAFYAKVTVGHVEAGLRTYDRYSPYPEEINRNLTSKLASLHFAPTELNRSNLAKEGITDGIFVTGNTALDAFQYTVKPGYVFADDKLRTLDFDNKQIVTLTAHRRENQNGGIENICRAVLALSEKYPNLHFVYPVHLSPAVRNTVFPILDGKPGITLTDPVDVADMHNLISKSHFIMTDSGGIQEEAPSFHKPVLVLRTETERPEAVAAGTVKVIGTDKERIVAEAELLLENRSEFMRMASASNPYGDGHASEKIVSAIKNALK
ncbi:MAG: UDP-N-acetylglucosamine 2-epimerase (non-hydrolyzing) [Clostridiales bacterium]|nr:UDP-N-acetylglucosamine 2-epimerase (non-hydrolyzing) [Clostridiales bacterium]